MNNPEAFKEDEVLSIKFVVPGLPFGKQRPKVTVRKFTGRKRNLQRLIRRKKQ